MSQLRSNNSGAMGAALSRPVGETPEVLARIRPYWFSRHFATEVLAGRPLPVDQHQLIAAIAPRPVYVASASQDPNADPEGELLSWREATTVWELYAHPRPDGGFPEPGGSRGGEGAAPVAYHLRPGPHSVERFDWERWLDSLDRWVSVKQT
ncbi:glucuronyl esterase domain-containing protein [Pseudactinotalea sp. Z1732]|uniref:glucuronyl esterase domain-containing protein n=1 Tax=Micrococcales TaxID=85006 RepID=UPI003C7AB14F